MRRNLHQSSTFGIFAPQLGEEDTRQSVNNPFRACIPFSCHSGVLYIFEMADWSFFSIYKFFGLVCCFNFFLPFCVVVCFVSLSGFSPCFSLLSPSRASIRLQQRFLVTSPPTYVTNVRCLGTNLRSVLYD